MKIAKRFITLIFLVFSGVVFAQIAAGLWNHNLAGWIGLINWWVVATTVTATGLFSLAAISLTRLIRSLKKPEE